MDMQSFAVVLLLAKDGVHLSALQAIFCLPSQTWPTLCFQDLGQQSPTWWPFSSLDWVKCPSSLGLDNMLYIAFVMLCVDFSFSQECKPLI